MSPDSRPNWSHAQNLTNQASQAGRAHLIGKVEVLWPAWVCSEEALRRAGWVTQHEYSLWLLSRAVPAPAASPTLLASVHRIHAWHTSSLPSPHLTCKEPALTFWRLEVGFVSSHQLSSWGTWQTRNCSLLGGSLSAAGFRDQQDCRYSWLQGAGCLKGQVLSLEEPECVPSPPLPLSPP